MRYDRTLGMYKNVCRSGEVILEFGDVRYGFEA